MKKLALIIGIAAMTALTACGGNKKENVQTEAATQETTAAETTAMGDYTTVSLPKEYEPLFYEGTVSDYTGGFISVNGENGEMKFDLEGAELPSEDEPIIRGCYVEVSYADAAENGTYPADGLSLLNDNEQLAQEENRDPVIYGKLQVMDINELEIVDDAGRTIDFDNSISRVVSFSDLKAGDNVIVTYAGSVYKNDDGSEDGGVFDGTPVAIKIVAEDAAKTEDAEANYIDGTVSGIEGNRIVLSTEIADFNCEVTDEAMLADVAEEQHVRVYYTGSITDIVISVEKLEKLD